MTVRADATEEEVDAAGLADNLLIGCALSCEILGVAVENMDILFGTVDIIEEILAHETVIALRMLLRKANILVHVECDDMFERYASLLAGFGEVGVHADRGRACRQTQNERFFG